MEEKAMTKNRRRPAQAIPPTGIRLLRAVVLFLCIVSAPACGARLPSENLLTGYGLDTVKNKPLRLSAEFTASEPFSLVLKPVQFRDSFVELIIYSIDADGKTHRSRNITLSGIDTNENFFQIGDAFQIPFPGRYRISFEQLGAVLGWAEVEITP